MTQHHWGHIYIASLSHNELMRRHRSWWSSCNVCKVLVCYLVGTKPIDNENFNRWVSKEHIDDIGMEFQFKFKWFHGLIQWWKSCLPYGDHLGPMRMEWGQMCVAYKYLSAKAPGGIRVFHSLLAQSWWQARGYIGRLLHSPIQGWL